jgi:hypothetical protein
MSAREKGKVKKSARRRHVFQNHIESTTTVLDELAVVLSTIAEKKDLDGNLMFRASVLLLQNTHGINILMPFL